MKQRLRFSFLFIALLAMVNSARAQQVNTMYFLENAPMRHTINPAFQPVSNFYLTFPAVGYTSLWVGNNALSLSDLVFNDGQGNTITALHPNAEGQLWNQLPDMLNLDADIHVNLFGFGWRIREKGYAHFNISEHITAGAGLPKSMFGPLFQQGINTWDLSKINASATVYTDIALGYSHIINDHWTVGGKLKVLLGHTHMSSNFDQIQFQSSKDQATLVGAGTVRQAGILQAIAERKDIDISTISGVWSYLIPMGYGGAIDLGVTYKPIKNLQISAAITDIGMIRWHSGSVSKLSIDTTFNGFGEYRYENYVYDGEFRSDSLLSDIAGNLEQYVGALHVQQESGKAFSQLLDAHLSIGVDANFWKNRIGLGVYSRTSFHKNRIREEITLGAALRPVNWFHLATSYSLMNGKWSNAGAAISFALYDGFMFTLAADYVPLSYTDFPISEDMVVPLPYKAKGMNFAFGFAIVAGTNPKKKKDKDKDGVMDYLDKCPNTPASVSVDAEGCPLDSDGDGIADYLDECPNTPAQANGLIDSVGCPLDTDLDGVADYLDKCPNTAFDERNYVDEDGCILDTDGDGIPDHLDECPTTPAAAYGYTDARGCPLDSDNDSVPDYMDHCPDTPVEAQGMVDKFGCPIDADRDGVADYKDACPNTIVAARNHVNDEGCPIDTDGDGIYDYEDACPTIAGDISNSGCPEIKQQVRTILTKAMRGIHFENGKATIKDDSYGILNEVAKVFIENPNYIVEIQGHTDNVGNYQYNLDLSEKRAQAVREYLIEHGVPAERLTAHGYGSDMPITTNDTKEGRTLNRRVAFKITFEETTYIEHN